MDAEMADPTLDWSSRFCAGDLIRLANGDLGVVDMVTNYSADDTPRWELIVTVIKASYTDTFVLEPWKCQVTSDEAALKQAREAGII